jgi:hypothetical protein
MKYCTLLFAVLICNGTLGAQTLNLKIVNAQTQEAIPYVAVFSKDNKEGSYADEQGNFAFEFGKGIDTILISTIGFQTQKMALQSLYQARKLELPPIKLDLPVVTITDAKSKRADVALGYFKRFRGIPTSSASTNANNRFAILIKSSIEQKAWITKLRIRFSVNQSSVASYYRIRLRIYSNNEGKPGKDILTSAPPIDIRDTQQSLEYAIPYGSIEFPPEGVFIGYDVLGYKDETGSFHVFKSGQNVPRKKSEWSDFLCPSIAVWQKAKEKEVFEANGIGAWRKSPMLFRLGAPMFGIVASFKE